MELKEGQKVIIKNKLNEIDNFAGGYIQEMDNVIGQIFTIKDLRTVKGRDVAHLEGNYWTWDIRALQPIEFNSLCDIKNGDIITLKNNDKLICIDNDGNLADVDSNNNNQVTDINDFNSDFEYSYDDKHPEYDIVKIERPSRYITLYEGKKLKEMTLKEVCEELGYEIKIVKEK